jgi:hypothetical protein
LVQFWEQELLFYYLWFFINDLRFNTRKNKETLGIIDALEQRICGRITIGYMVSLRLISQMYVRDYS